MSWILHNLGVLVATMAVGLSFATAAFNRRQRQQDMYLRVHETLIEVEMQHGRRALYECGRTGKLPPEGSTEFARISRTLSVHNAVAIYIRRGIVPRRWVLQEWRNTLCDMRRGLDTFRRYRQVTYGWPVLVELEALIASAEVAAIKHEPAVDENGRTLQPRYVLGTNPDSSGDDGAERATSNPASGE